MKTEAGPSYSPNIETDAPQEKCGIFGIFAPEIESSMLVDMTIAAGGGLQHRGQNGVGVKFEGQTREVYPKQLVSDALTKSEVNKFKANDPSWGILHILYGTQGDYGVTNVQPCEAHTSEGERISVIHNGEFIITSEMHKEAGAPAGASDTYVVTQLIAKAEGETIEDKLLNTIDRLKGAFSLILTTEEKMLVARDPLGIRPLVFGRIGENGYVFASETHPLNKIGIKTEREIRKGEVMRITRNGMTIIREGEAIPGNFCDFERAYFSRPDSRHPTFENADDGDHHDRWEPHWEFRFRTGEILAEESPIENATFVVGAPDSGTPFASGFAARSGIPYLPIILRDHYDGTANERTFLGDAEMSQIRSKVKGKLSFIPSERWKDAVVVIGDDSLVRGTTSKIMVQLARELGAKEVHFVIGFPAVKHPCHLGVSMRGHAELIAADGKDVAQEIGADSVRYISHRGFLGARLPEGNIVNPKDPDEIFLANGGCGGCITGIYPINREGESHRLVKKAYRHRIESEMD